MRYLNNFIINMSWKIFQAKNAPSARSSHQLSSFGSCVYLYGGEDGPRDSHFGYGNPVLPGGAVHFLNLREKEPAWKTIATSSPGPSPRLGHGQAIDAAGALYVFGGRQPEQPGALDRIASLNDMHKLDLVWMSL